MTTRWIRWVALMVVLLAQTACSLRMPPPDPPVVVPVSRPQAATHVDVWLLSDNLHTGLVFEYDWLVRSGFVPPAGLRTSRYVSMSWGDRKAYMETRWLSPAAVVHALFMPSPAVMEIIPFDTGIPQTLPNQRIWHARVAADRGPALAAFLNHVNQPGPDGRPQIAGPSSWGDGHLMESRHAYFLPRMCNLWTAQAMESMGMEVRPWSALFADGVIRQAEQAENGFVLIWGGREDLRQGAP